MLPQNDDDAVKKFSFDPTINLGHVLTFGAMVLGILASWNVLDKRITVLEERKEYQHLRDSQQDTAVASKFEELKATLGEVKDGVKEILRDQRDDERGGKK